MVFHYSGVVVGWTWCNPPAYFQKYMHIPTYTYRYIHKHANTCKYIHINLKLPYLSYQWAIWDEPNNRFNNKQYPSNGANLYIYKNASLQFECSTKKWSPWSSSAHNHAENNSPISTVDIHICWVLGDEHFAPCLRPVSDSWPILQPVENTEKWKSSTCKSASLDLKIWFPCPHAMGKHVV